MIGLSIIDTLYWVALLILVAGLIFGVIYAIANPYDHTKP